MCDTAKAILKREMYTFKDKISWNSQLKNKTVSIYLKNSGGAQLRKSEETKEERK